MCGPEDYYRSNALRGVLGTMIAIELLNVGMALWATIDIVGMYDSRWLTQFQWAMVIYFQIAPIIDVAVLSYGIHVTNKGDGKNLKRFGIVKTVLSVLASIPAIINVVTAFQYPGKPYPFYMLGNSWADAIPLIMGAIVFGIFGLTYFCLNICAIVFAFQAANDIQNQKDPNENQYLQRIAPSVQYVVLPPQYHHQQPQQPSAVPVAYPVGFVPGSKANLHDEAALKPVYPGTS